ncbi:MAG: hydroxymyristoyl-ACP dehydratase [Ignavibacteria bacterium RBG_16_34_14]|nr:MAG: hydroxymyristoyl-ACP dehydratase [Ignavibacteria bacterium RBG_16_34_14]
MEPEKIISLLPYSKPFLFVDSITKIDENYVEGEYKFRKDEFFYEGHFINFPVTPGVILIETMTQIGVVCLGIFLLKDKISPGKFPEIALISSEVNFYLPVFPEEKVKVISEKVYFRLGKLKCNIQMKNEKGEVVCKGLIAGMAKPFSASIG